MIKRTLLESLLAAAVGSLVALAAWLERIGRS